MVSPLRSNSRLLTTSTRTPASVSRPNAVWCGCHSSGSTDLSQNSALSSRSVPGTRLVKPTRPCVPGVSPVPSEVRLVAVVDGTPAVPGAESASSDDRYGAVPAYRSSSCEPRPSTRNRTYAGASGSTRPVGAARASLPSARPIAGTTSPSPRWPYAGSMNGSINSSGSWRRAARRTTAGGARRPGRRRRPRRAARSRRRPAHRCSRGRPRTAGRRSRPAPGPPG